MSQVRVEDISLPMTRHLPGTHTNPDSELLQSITLQACESTADATAADNVAWLYGIRLFNSAYYWEAHEVWETVWLNAAPNSRERSLVQACIHLTNARLKSHLAKANAAARLYVLALDSLDRTNSRAGDRLLGVSIQQLYALSNVGIDVQTEYVDRVVSIECEYLEL